MLSLSTRFLFSLAAAGTLMVLVEFLMADPLVRVGILELELAAERLESIETAISLLLLLAELTLAAAPRYFTTGIPFQVRVICPGRLIRLEATRAVNHMERTARS